MPASSDAISHYSGTREGVMFTELQMVPPGVYHCYAWHAMVSNAVIRGALKRCQASP